MKLYRLEIERREGKVACYVVAPTEKQAAIMVIDHGLELGKEYEQFSLERIDTKLADEPRLGLDEILARGPAGFASFVEPVGWLVHAPVQQPLSFYRFFTPEGDNTYVVAENDQQAVDLYTMSYLLADGEHRLFRFEDGLADLSPEQHTRLESILEFGPTGIATYNDLEGWSVRPPV